MKETKVKTTGKTAELTTDGKDGQNGGQLWSIWMDYKQRIQPSRNTPQFGICETVDEDLKESKRTLQTTVFSVILLYNWAIKKNAPSVLAENTLNE